METLITCSRVFYSLLFLLQPHVKVCGETIVMLSPPHTANVRTYTNTARALTAMGHTVYVPIPVSMLDGNKVDTRGLNVIRYGKNMVNIEKELNDRVLKQFWDNQTMGLSDMAYMAKLGDKIVDAILDDVTLEAQIRAVNPSMFVLNQVPPFRGVLALPYKLGVPVCMLSPYPENVGIRVPISLATTPPLVNGDFSEANMTFSQRLTNSILNLALFAFHGYLSGSTLVAKHAPNRPLVSLEYLLNSVEVFLVESDYIMDYARPQMPNVKYIGSTAGNPARPLEAPFFDFMEKGPASLNGVVVVTFGSAIKRFPPYVADKLIRTFMRLKQRVVWRAEGVVSPDSDHLLISTWLPQNDLLGHKNTKLFVSHCGMNGQYEALYHAVPTLCLPLINDMHYNAQRGVSKGFGLKADIREITSDELLVLMNEMINNGEYKINIFKASNLYRELFPSPVNTSAYWIDHVMKHGGKYMRHAGQNMPMYQFLGLDVLALMLIVCCVVLTILYITCMCTWRVFCGKRLKKKAE